MKRFGMTSVILLGTLLVPVSSHAALQVTEIMYNPPGANAGRQWVEVTNTGPASVDLTAKNLRFFDASGNHLIKTDGSLRGMLSAGGIAVIAQNLEGFKADWPAYVGMLFKSSFSLTSSGIVGFIQTDGTTLTSATYSSDVGAANDGNSLQQPKDAAPGAWSVGRPTPGSYPATPPAAIAAPVKPSAPKASSSNRVSTSKTGSSSRKSTQSTTRSSSSAYDSGTVAPAAAADAVAAGALPWSFAMPSFATPSVAFLTQLASSVWFAVFIALVTFSSFSLLMIQRHYIP